MTFAEDLLRVAQDLADLHARDPRQACMRRAISTAYYALFHHLISEATLNWARPELRPTLGRFFEHGVMNSASQAKLSELNSYFNGNPPDGPERTFAEHFRTVVNALIRAYQSRQDADYNTAFEFTETEMSTQIATVADAFESWKVIRDDIGAQTFLLSLMGNKERRQSENRRQPHSETKRQKKARRSKSIQIADEHKMPGPIGT